MADIDLCPRCQAPLPFVGAKKCECGWKKRERHEAKPEKIRIPVPCAYDGCRYDATIMIHRPTGWANVCRNHYEMLISAEAHAYTKARGLTTVAQMQAWIKDKNIGRGQMHGPFLAAYLRSHPAKERVPGEDDEEIAA